MDWVRQELEALEKAGVITRSVSPWASPIVIVPKKAAQENHQREECVWIIEQLNSLLPSVTKPTQSKRSTHFGSIPKIDEIYAA